MKQDKSSQAQIAYCVGKYTSSQLMEPCKACRRRERFRHLMDNCLLRPSDPFLPPSRQLAPHHPECPNRIPCPRRIFRNQ